MKDTVFAALFGLIASVGAVLILDSEQRMEPPVVLKSENSFLNDGYLACTSPALLYKARLDDVQCMATSDLQKYKVVEITMHSDNTAEVTFDLLDDSTAILWMPREAIANVR